MTDLARLAEASAALGAPLDASQVACLERYHRALLESPHNVTALSAEGIVDELFLDALAGVPLVRALEGDVVDLGTGGGTPGIPLAIALPERRFVLIDANGKKVAFVQSVIDALGLPNAEARCLRAEEAGRDAALRERFGVGVAKAVAPLRVLLEWLVPLVSPSGRIACWKGPAAAAEVAEAETAMVALGASMERSVPYGDGRVLLVLRRDGALDPRFPRRVGVASKRPL